MEKEKNVGKFPNNNGKRYEVKMVDNKYFVENSDYEVIFDLEGLEKSYRIFTKLETFFLKLTNYRGDYRELRCIVDDNLVSIFVIVK